MVLKKQKEKNNIEKKCKVYKIYCIRDILLQIYHQRKQPTNNGTHNTDKLEFLSSANVPSISASGLEANTRKPHKKIFRRFWMYTDKKYGTKDKSVRNKMLKAETRGRSCEEVCFSHIEEQIAKAAGLEVVVKDPLTVKTFRLEADQSTVFSISKTGDTQELIRGRMKESSMSGKCQKEIFRSEECSKTTTLEQIITIE
ncbi:uncharacterized protein ACN427_003863 isoform 1-T1 [Glossina fuscipes fuscipes]